MILDILASVSMDHPEIDYLWPGGLMAGTVGALVAPGGSGKSMWALQAAVAVAGGPDTLDLRPRHHGPVLYLSAEDPPLILMRRLRAIALGVPGDPLENFEGAAERLYVQPIIGQRVNLLDERHVISLTRQCSGIRLVILDTLSRMHMANENDNGQMSAVIGSLERIAANSGATILYLHHANKLSVLNGQGDLQQAARGASALIDNARWCGYVSRMSRDESDKYSDDPDLSTGAIGDERRKYYIKYGVSKHNYDMIPDERWYKWIGGSLAPVRLLDNSNGNGKKGKDRGQA